MRSSPERNLVVIAMKRSGNNAIKDWLVHGRSFAIQGNVRPEHVGRASNSTGATPREIVPWPLDLAALQRHGCWSFRVKSRLGYPLFIGLEDQPFVSPEVASGRHVLIVRSFDNVFSSRLERSKTGHPAYPRGLSNQLHQQVAWWCNHVDVMKAHTDSNGIPLEGAQVIPIYYDRWLWDTAYRTCIGGMLGVANPERLPVKRGMGGGGSSFEGRTSLENTASHNRLLERSSLLTAAHAKVLQHLMEDPEVAVRRALLKRLHGGR